MASEQPHPNARQYVESLAATGRCHFDSAEGQALVGVSTDAARAAVNRPAKQKFIASPAWIDPQKLAAATAPVAWAQRLGYVLEHVGCEKTPALRARVGERAQKLTSLLPGAPHRNAPRHDEWKLYVNVEVETEL